MKFLFFVIVAAGLYNLQKTEEWFFVAYPYGVSASEDTWRYGGPYTSKDQCQGAATQYKKSFHEEYDWECYIK